MNIVSFDPGLTTGAVVVVVNSDCTFRVVKTCTLVWANRFGVLQLLQGTDPNQLHLPDVILIELFRLYAHKAADQINSDFPSSQVTGIIESYAHMLGILDRVYKQPASVISRVQILPEHKPSLAMSPHVRDAYKHARYYILTKMGFPIVGATTCTLT